MSNLIKRVLAWIFGTKQTIVWSNDCPTCGLVTADFPCDDGPDFTCEEMRQMGQDMVDSFDYIYTKNKYRAEKVERKEWCAPRRRTAQIVNTGNRCEYIGEVKHTGNGSEICMECMDCGDSENDGLQARYSSTSSSSSSSSSSSGPTGSSGTVDLDSLSTGDCMLDNTCPPANCGYWYKLNNVKTVFPVSNMSIEGRDRRNRTQSAGGDSVAGDSGGGGSLESRGGDDGGGGDSLEPRGGRGDTNPRRGRGGDGRPPRDDPNDGTDPGDDDNGNTGGERTRTDGGSECTPELIYDDTGCKVIGVKPILLAEGEMGYYESTELYPLTKGCDGEYIYGDDAGKPIRYHRMPNTTIEPHYLSFQTGVVSHLDPGNKERNNTYARFIQIDIEGLEARKDTQKPLDQKQPYTILVAPRTQGNKSVIASGLFINTFKGNIHGEHFAIPKNGVNSPEYFDKQIYYGGDDTHRGGENMDKAAMVFHSPDTEFDRPSLNADTVKLEMGMFGKGMRHMLYAEGDLPDSKEVGRKNQKGTVQTVNLSQYQRPGKAITKCVKAISYAKANTVTDKGLKFTYPLLNIFRESSVYVEVKGEQEKLMGTKNTGMPNNGHPSGNLGNDGTSDYSFLGDQLHHMCPIHNAAAWYGSLTTYNPSQYGGLANRTYVSLLEVSWNMINEGGFTTDKGDSYINLHFLSRKSYVSDKIMKEISPILVAGGFPSGKSKIAGGLLRKMFETVGLEECGTKPESADISDPRNGYANGKETQQALRKSIAGGCWSGKGTPPEATGIDIYFPNVLKTGIWFVVESDVNLHYRATGSIENGEVYPDKLQGLNIHSEYPKDSDWTKGLLNRFYVRMNENPKWRMIWRVIFNLIFTYAIGVYVAIYGTSSAIDSFQELDISWTDLNIGGVIGSIMKIVIAALGVAWIVFWAGSDIDNKFIDSLLSIDGCWPDITVKKGKEEIAWRIKDGRVIQFEDNYWRYNYDYSRQNKIRISFGMPDPYSTCKCPLETTYEILYSNRQDPMSMTDAYRNFKVNNYNMVPSHSGKIKKIIQVGHGLYIKTSDMLFSMQSGPYSGSGGDSGSPYMGNGKFLSGPIEVFGGLREGRGGTNDPNSGISTQWGFIDVDVEAKKLMVFDGNSYQSLGDFGMSKFLSKYIPYQDIGNAIRDEKSPSGIGFSLGVDNEMGFLYVSKTDRIGGKDRSWTLTFDLRNQCWVSFEYFKPTVYSWDRNRSYLFNGNEFWQQNKEGEFQTVFGVTKPMVIDFVIRDAQVQDDFKYESTLIDAEYFRFDGSDFVPQNDQHFTYSGAYNSYQSSGLMKIVDSRTQDTIENIMQNDNQIQMTYLHRKQRLNNLIDKVGDEIKNSKVFTGFNDDFFTDFIDDILDDEKVDTGLFDNHMVQRLVYSGESSVKLFLRGVQTNTETEIR